MTHTGTMKVSLEANPIQYLKQNKMLNIMSQTLLCCIYASSKFDIIQNPSNLLHCLYN